MDESTLAAYFELSPQLPDANVERVRFRAEVEPPHAREDERARQHLARVAQEQLEQRELGQRQLEPFAAPNDFVRGGIEGEIRESQDVGPDPALAAQEPADPRK